MLEVMEAVKEDSLSKAHGQWQIPGRAYAKGSPVRVSQRRIARVTLLLVSACWNTTADGIVIQRYRYLADLDPGVQLLVR